MRGRNPPGTDPIKNPCQSRANANGRACLAKNFNQSETWEFFLARHPDVAIDPDRLCQVSRMMLLKGLI